MKSYKILINKHFNENCFVVGAGPSLYDCFINYRFKEIFKHVVISVNSSIVVMPWNTENNGKRYWISNDALSRRWSWWKDVLRSNCTKVVRNSWLKYKKEIPGFLIFKPRTTSEGIIDPKDNGLCYCSSVPSAIDLSLFLGCKRIFLLGVDHYDVGGKSHFWQLMSSKYHQRQIRPAQGPFSQQKKVFPINILAYKALLKFAKYKKAEIYNCSILSKVEVFEKISFDYILNLIKK